MRYKDICPMKGIPLRSLRELEELERDLGVQPPYSTIPKVLCGAIETEHLAYNTVSVTLPVDA